MRPRLGQSNKHLYSYLLSAQDVHDAIFTPAYAIHIPSLLPRNAKAWDIVISGGVPASAFTTHITSPTMALSPRAISSTPATLSRSTGSSIGSGAWANAYQMVSAQDQVLAANAVENRR